MADVGHPAARADIDIEDALNYEITPTEVRQRQERKEEFTLLDVREPWERDTSSIVPSTHIPMADIPSRVQELDPEQDIVVYCHHGVRSLSVTDWLRKQGYEKVQSMSGGIDLWSREIDPRVPRY
jgi:rhodanese-related sulfurtransferase